jgi:hypothetical protein
MILRLINNNTLVYDKRQQLAQLVKGLTVKKYTTIKLYEVGVLFYYYIILLLLLLLLYYYSFYCTRIFLLQRIIIYNVVYNKSKKKRD